MNLNNGDILVYNGTNWVNSSSQAAPATANNGLVSLGNGGWAGGAPNFVGNASGTVIAANAASGFGGNLIDLQVAGASYFSVTNGSQTVCAKWDTNSGLNGHALVLEHRLPSGNPASGFGVGIQFGGLDTSTPTPAVIEIGTIQCIETNPAQGNVSSYLTFTTMFAGTEGEILRLRAAGASPGQLWCRGDLLHAGTNLAFFNATPTTQQTGGAATAAATYGANEQSMLQKAYNCLRTFGLLS